MQSNYFVTIFAFIAIVLYFTGFLFVKKSDNALNIIMWLPLSFFLSYVLIAAIIGIVNLFAPINLLTASFICLALSAVLWFFVYKKGRQKFFIQYIDIVAFVSILMIAGFFAYKQFGGSLNPIYETSDPAVHLKMAMNVVNNEKVVGMYFAPLFNALFIEFFGVFVDELCYYKIFILSDILMFVLSGFLFYTALCCKKEKNKYKICALFLTLAYMLGYPLNNMVFGFVYLGIGVSIIITIIIFANGYIDSMFNRVFNIVILNVLLFSIGICYSLFAPIVYFAVLFVGVFLFAREKKLFSITFVIEQLKIFLFPSIITVYYLAFTGNATSLSHLSTEGYIYKDLYSNFFLLAPMLLFMLYNTVKKHKIDFSVILTALTIIFMLIALVLGLKGAVSAYYYYKLYYPLWALCFYLAYLTIKEIGEAFFSLVAAALISVALFFFISVVRIDAKIQAINVQFNPVSSANDLFDVYSFNSGKIILNDNVQKRINWKLRFELYDYMLKNCLSDNTSVQLADDWLNVYWYEAVTNQRMEVYYWQNPSETMKSIASDSYVVVIPNSEIYNQNKEYFDSLEKVFENELGYVAIS